MTLKPDFSAQVATTCSSLSVLIHGMTPVMSLERVPTFRLQFDGDWLGLCALSGIPTSEMIRCIAFGRDFACHRHVAEPIAREIRLNCLSLSAPLEMQWNHHLPISGRVPSLSLQQSLGRSAGNGWVVIGSEVNLVIASIDGMLQITLEVEVQLL
ncbi:hypothetical protein [Synechococcus sp. A15-44]|uniref:hypothetical protein n=1 Tax=Synechococcus sp. A15-44 TaxID=1050646 RepID=UPI0016474F48|nr:hypothetical protein [Synechococcus sp. A15-44]